MFGRIVLVLLLVFIASTCGIMAIAFGSKQTPESLEKINKDQEDPTTLPGLFESAHLDSSRTSVVWNDRIDLPSDTIREYGGEVPVA